MVSRVECPRSEASFRARMRKMEGRVEPTHIRTVFGRHQLARLCSEHVEIDLRLLSYLLDSLALL